MKIKDLFLQNLIHRGLKAVNNPEFSDSGFYALGIANKDYPARTPFLWNTVYQNLGMPERNIRTYGSPADAAEIFRAFREDRCYIGGDVGVGFKDKVLDLLDEIDPKAETMGAINVMVKKSRRLKGYNTDGEGYAVSLEQALAGPLRDKKVVLLGAGGTGNSIAVSLAGRGAHVVILNRTKEKAEALADRVNRHFGVRMARGGGRDLIPSEITDADAVVATIDEQDTPLDQYSALAPIPAIASPEAIAENLLEAKKLLALIPKTAVISDVMLRPADTATIRTAKELGFRTLDGNPMVLNQAIEAFFLVNELRLRKLGVDKSRVAQIMHEASA